MRAVNPAGATQAEYVFSTLTMDGSTIAPPAGQPDASAQADLVGNLRTQFSAPHMLRRLHVLLPSACAALLLLLVVLLLRSLRARLALPIMTVPGPNSAQQLAHARSVATLARHNTLSQSFASNNVIGGCASLVASDPWSAVRNNCPSSNVCDTNTMNGDSTGAGTIGGIVSEPNSDCTNATNSTSMTCNSQQMLMETRYAMPINHSTLGSSDGPGCAHLDSQLAYACTHLPQQCLQHVQQQQQAEKTLRAQLENNYEDTCTAGGGGWPQKQNPIMTTGNRSSSAIMPGSALSSFRAANAAELDSFQSWRFS